jgi:hypothetical protein
MTGSDHLNRYSAITASLFETRHKPLSECSYKFLSPVEKLGEDKTHAPWEACACPALTVRLMDIINESGKSEKPIFKKIIKKGGIHAFLGFDGNVILSSIMPDKAIYGMTPERHAEIINAIKPNYYFTPDGETYTNEPNLAGAVEIPRMLEESKVLLDKAKKSEPIGLVKGSTLEQIKSHTDSLAKMGIKDFVFHTGDFLAGGSNSEIDKAKTFTKEIRRQARVLLLYGMGINFKNFWWADGFITQSHYINAFYGQEMTDGRWVNNGNETANRKTIMANLEKLEGLLIVMQGKKIVDWGNQK